MEKKLKKVQRGAAFGFVVLKILRILLIIAAVLMIAGLVFLAVVNENDLPIDGIQDGKLMLDLESLDLGEIGLDKFLDLKGMLDLDLRDVKLVVLMLIGVAILAIAAAYVLLLTAGRLFKHIKNEETPFTTGNVRRLRLLGVFHILLWACGIALSYFVSMEIIRRLALPTGDVRLSLNLSALLLSLVYFFLARVFSFGKAQGDALQQLTTAPAPEPVPAPAPVAAPAPEPEPVPAPEPVAVPAPEPVAAPEPAPVVEAAPAEAVEPPAVPEE